jgi:hypothetical protein
VSPVSEANGHNAPWLGDERVPGVTAVIKDVVVGFEDPVGQPVVAHELPDVFSGIEFRARGRQCQQREVGWNLEPPRHMPACLIKDQDGVAAGRDFGRDFGKVKVHRLDVAGRQDQSRALSLIGTDGTEDVSRRGALISWCGWAGSALRPAAGDLVLLPDASLIREPDLYQAGSDVLLLCDLRQLSRETFLKSSIAPGPWA